MWIPRARRYARRLTPLAMEAWRRWQAMTPEQRERYKKQARGYAERGRKAIEQQRRKKRRGR